MMLSLVDIVGEFVWGIFVLLRWRIFVGDGILFD